MATVLPTAERGLEATRISVEPPSALPMPSSRRPYGPGDNIDGKYELESLLGKGGMGEVWTARNTTLGVRRALKLIRTDAGNPDSTDRLLYEAQAAARLVEPAIVRVFDFGKTSWGDPYIVMEMLEGEDLMNVIRRRERLSPVKAARALLPVIRALAGAHTHGIVHRDLKPENIFLAKLPDGRVQPKLLDFGIAKLKNAIGLRLTTDGAVMGSPLYMAPEQARGEDVDERADVWALTVVLYESITGQPPFTGDDRAQVARAVAEASPPRLSQHNVEDESLWPILSRGLEKRREDRWASMEELGRALARWLLDAGVNDDITGASLEAGWFRTSRQSLFGSSAPPLRTSLAESSLPKLGSPPLPVIQPAASRAFAPILPFLRTARAACAKALARFAGQDRARSWRIGAIVTLTLGSLFAWLVLSGPGSDAAARPDDAAAAAPAFDEPVPSADLSGVAAWPPAALTPPPEAVPEAAAPLADDAPAPAAAPSREPRLRAKAKKTASDAARSESKEHRRSKLIDPYR
jgi:serine/threonine protein kinase